MKPTKLIVLGAALWAAGGLTGCGQWIADEVAQEQKRLELEKQAQRDAQKANQAITHMNQKLGRKPPELGLGITTKTKAPPPADQSQQP